MEEFTVAHLTLLIFCIGFSPLVLREFQLLYYNLFNKIFFLNFHLFKRKLTDKEIRYLYENVDFYKLLDIHQKKYFEYRVAYFLKNIQFISRNIHVSHEMKLLISSTIATLVFGYRNFKLKILRNVIVYPEQYVSSRSGEMHKGEFNPKLKTVVLSWKDFLLGFASFDDNINLGIHEFTHVLHANSRTGKDLNSIIFKKEYKSLLNLIKTDKYLKAKIKNSQYFREYAFNNQYELLAVLVEHFIESPDELNSEFPNIYKSIKKMLNFNFGNY